ncbi:MAG: 3',5'-cyclic-nucleotide phosphodiesterase [Desulfuromonadales bacterium]|nr:3',5'-cyclic-nucleotide phosphodiesterase [Desulfuromonadales bacterium]
MNVRVLGSCGSRVPGHQTSCLLIDGQVVVDAGGITAKLSVEEQAGIDHVLISHAHLDHVCDLAFLADNVMAMRTEPLRVWAPEEVLDALHRNLFNDQLWPDLTRLRLGDAPVLELCCLAKGVPARIGSLEVRWAPTSHTVFAAGYLLTSEASSILYSGDTTTTDALWALGRTAENLAAVFVETSFPNRLESLALETGHLTPALLDRELAKLDKPEVPVKIFHMKPQYLEEIGAELASCQKHWRVLNGNERFVF